MYDDYLYHHGIKGMKWGVRRFRKTDGSLTAEGRRRYNEDGGEQPRKVNGKKVAAGIAGAAAAAGLAYAMYNPKSRAVIASMANKTASQVYKAATSPQVKAFVKKAGAKTAKAIGASASRVGNAMVDAALMSIGGIAIAKLTAKLSTADDTPENIRNRNKVLLDTGTAGIQALTKASSGSSGNHKSASNASVGADVSSILGQPSKKSIDKSGVEWQSLFKDSGGNQRSQEVRSTVKSLANAGYDINQIRQYLNAIDNGTIKHTAMRWKITKRSARSANPLILFV